MLLSIPQMYAERIHLVPSCTLHNRKLSVQIRACAVYTLILLTKYPLLLNYIPFKADDVLTCFDVVLTGFSVCKYLHPIPYSQPF